MNLPSTREEFTHFALDPVGYLQGQPFRELIEWVKATHSKYPDLISIMGPEHIQKRYADDRVGWYTVCIAGYELCSVRQNNISHSLYGVIQAKLEEQHNEHT